MKRLTTHDELRQPWVISANERTWQNIYKKLTTYEDTGLDPEDVTRLCEMDKRARMAKMLQWEQAESDGRLMVLPCKVGDTVYYLTGNPTLANGFNFNRVEESVCDGFLIDRSGVQIRLRYDWHGTHGTYGYFGKTVFFTREEAEAALEERDRHGGLTQMPPKEMP